MDNRYKYPEEKFSQARRYLMLPTRPKESATISQACSECLLGLSDVPLDDLDEKTQGHIAKLKELMGKKQKLTAADKQELCEAINYLAYYFHDRWTGVWG